MNSPFWRDSELDDIDQEFVYKIVTKPAGYLWDWSCSEHLKWLKENNITKFRWKWANDGSHVQGILFVFEDERDRLHFAMRWA